MRILLLFLTLLTSQTILAQTGKGSVKLTIAGETGNPLEGATAELIRAADSALVRTALTDRSGLAEWVNLAPGSYRVRVSNVGFTTRYTDAFTLQEGEAVLVLPQVALAANKAASMQGVTVTAKKPFIQKLSDRIVVNVESSIVSAGSSALDVMERSPGITIDQNDVLALRGRSGVMVMIDGKPSPLSATDLANYLRGLPANAVERIDIITNPSAKYDAAGNSGIIDIRMKKDQRLGTNGTFTAGYGQGIYPKANTGTTFNYRNKKFNLFGNYNYSYRKGLNHLIINRNFYNNGVFEGSDDKDNYASFPVNNHSARLGADFFPTKKSIIGVVVTSNFNHFRRNARIETRITDANYLPEAVVNTTGRDNNRNNNFVANLNFKHSFDTKGRELTADLDYGQYNSKALTRTASRFFNTNGTPKRDDDILDGDQQGSLIFRTAKADYVQPLEKGMRFEAGVKTSWVSSDNNAQFFNVLPGGAQVDITKTNRFFYKEFNNAGYVNLSREFKKWNMTVGLRGEQTEVRTRQVKGDKRYGMDYFRLFPSAFFNYKLNEEKTLGLSVSRRIDRPGYGQLNPFLQQIDPSIYGTGNPFLRPQMTWSYEGSYTVKQLNFTLGYSHTTDPQEIVLSRILDVIPDFEIPAGQDSNITVQIPVNLGTVDYVGLTATTPIRVSKWWNMVNNVNVYYNHYTGNLGARLDRGAVAANIRTNNNFTLGKGWAAELSANLNTGGQSGYMRMQPQWALAVGGQKTIFQGKGTVRLNFTDIFWTSLPKGKVTYEGRYVENWRAYRETRTGNFTFTYRFGNNKVQAARKRSTASEEERQRAQ